MLTKNDREVLKKYFAIRKELKEYEKNGIPITYNGKLMSANCVAKICAFSCNGLSMHNTIYESDNIHFREIEYMNIGYC